MDQTCGGYTETKNATKEIQTICDQVKPQVEQKTGEKYEVFTALQDRSQLVNGTNYLIKVHVGGSSYLLLKVYQSFSGELGEPSVKKDHKDDPIVPF